MNIFVEKLARTNGEQKSLSFDNVTSEIKTASLIAKTDDFSSALAEMGDVIHVNGKLFLVEADQSVTPIEQDEYAYYKDIDAKDRLAQWFAGSLN